MKIISSLFLAIVSLCATNLVHAQEAVTTPVKPVEIKNNDIIVQKPTGPAIQPGNTIVPQTGTETPQAAPSEPKKEDNKNAPDKSKTQALQLETTPANLTRKEPVEVQPLITPNTNTVKPVPVQKPVVKEQ